MLVAPFGTKIPIQCPTADARVNVQTEDKEIITINGHVVEYLTQELQVVDIPNNEEFEDLISYRKEPDMLIGADYFFKFIDLQDKQKLHSGHTLVQSKVGPMIVGSGYIDRLCNSKSHPSPIICSVCTNPNLDLENFWKLEMIGIQESPTDNDDEQAMNHFKQTIIKLDGRYQVCWPWKDSKTKLSDNYGLCTRRLKNLRRQRSPNTPIINSSRLVAKRCLPVSISQFISNKEITSTTGSYISISGKRCQPISSNLNEAQAIIRQRFIVVILPDLVGVLLRFRAMNIVITADIEKAFLQIGLQEEERNCTRFLWVKDVNKETKGYVGPTGDQPLNEMDQQDWKKLIEGWPEKVIEIPRYVIDLSSYSEFHVFTDASQTAYFAAVYIRNCVPGGWSRTFLIFAKSRIAPIKGNDEFEKAVVANMTIPTSTQKRTVIQFIEIHRFKKWEEERE
ncbi:unnamed protein product [Onchocerca ochengi]|uniref:DUF1758 domain-containing protein n=1 Tax=Onchocerca ochengi TaxID=42157 RepID=A0A182EDE0_ONCOC|nr:unnamed protein product [Onchocerca ochengi]